MASTTGPGTSLLWTSRGHNMKTVGCGLDKEKSINTVCFYLLRLKFSPDSASGRRTRSHLTEGIFASGAASKAGSSSSSSQSCSTKAVLFSTRKLAACRSPSPNHSTSEWFLPLPPKQSLHLPGAESSSHRPIMAISIPVTQQVTTQELAHQQHS